MTTTRPMAFGLSLLVAIGLSACAADDGDRAPATDAPVELTIGLTYTPDIQFAPFYVAEAGGYFAAAGLDVTLRHHGQSESLFGALTSGEEQLVAAGGAEMLQAHAEGIDVVNVATLYQTYPVTLIVPEDSDIHAPADIADHSIGLPGPYGENYFGLLVLLAEAGLTEDEANIEYIGFTQQSALIAGHVDAVIGFSNNDLVGFETAGFAARAVPLSSGELPLVGIGIGVDGELLDADPAAVEAVVTAVAQAVADIVADPQAALETASEYVPGLPDPDRAAAAAATLAATVPLYEPPAGEPIGYVDVAQWEAMAELLAEHGLLAGEVDLDRVVRDDLLG